MKPQGTDTVPTMLTPGEFVQRKRAVDYYGLPFMNAINSMKFPRYMATGGPVVASGGAGRQAGPMQVELLPHQIRQIVQGVSVNIAIGNQQVANAANAANGRSAQRGSN